LDDGAEQTMINVALWLGSGPLLPSRVTHETMYHRRIDPQIMVLSLTLSWHATLGILESCETTRARAVKFPTKTNS
jgi:hypothetical protein